MGAEQAVGVMHRRALEAADDAHLERRRLADAYSSEHLSAQSAARLGAVDAVIRPGDTRARLAWALSTIAHHRRPASVRNIPL
jgi:acetyl-CoA carboxylase carboxyltransferase component